jgi:putative peptide zinc metalloprotease protein
MTEPGVDQTNVVSGDDHGAGSSTGGDEYPRLVPGVELIGEYRDSGFEEPPYLVRRPDGQVIQLARPLYLVAERADGRRHLGDIAAEVSRELERGLTGDDVSFLIDNKLAPLGVVALDEGARDAAPSAAAQASPLLALQAKVGVVPPPVVRTVASLFKGLFATPLVVVVVAGLVAFDAWLFFTHGVGQAARNLLYDPLLMLVLLAVVVAGTAFHEIGHAAAASYGGVAPGVMGAGLYVVWPVFYTDVSESYRLGRAGRVRTDLGGVYFNAIWILGLGGLYALTGAELVLLIALAVHFQMLQQLLPLVRLDGYLILSDLTGVPDLFARIGPTLRSLLPWREAEPRVKELKRWARNVVRAWVLVVVPTLLFVVALVVINLPRLIATGWDSFTIQAGRTGESFGEGALLAGVVNGLRTGLLLAPPVAAVVTFVRLGRRVTAAVVRWSAGSAPRQVAAAGSAVALAVVVGWLWWPGEQYQPLGPQDRWTVQEGARQVSSAVTGGGGHPALAGRRTEAVAQRPGDEDPAAEDSPGPSDGTSEAPDAPGPSTTAATSTSTTVAGSTTTSVPTSTSSSTTTPASTTTTAADG